MVVYVPCSDALKSDAGDKPNQAIITGVARDCVCVCVCLHKCM